MTNPSQFRLRQFSKPVKRGIIAFVLCLTVAYLFGMGQILLNVGLSKKAVAEKYHGSAPAKMDAGEEQELNLDDDQADVPAAASAPSLKSLVALAHTHLFGMASFFFCLTLLGAFTEMRDGFKSVMLVLPWISIVIDNVSFFATRFAGAQFAALTILAGALMALSFAWLCLAILFETLQEEKT